MKFRSVVLLGIIGLVLGVLLATAMVVAGVLERSARDALAADLARGSRAFADLQELQQTLLREESHVVADEPRLKAVVATQDVSRDTVVGVVMDLGRAAHRDLFLLTDAAGHLVVDTSAPTAVGVDLAQNPLVAAALASGSGEGVMTRGKQAFLGAARRLEFGGEAVGVVVIGRRIDDALAETGYRYTGDSVVVTMSGDVVAASTFEGTAPTDRAALMTGLATTDGNGLHEVSIAGTRYLAYGAPLSASPSAALRYVVLRSLDRALEPGRRIVRVVYGIAAASLFGALLLALVLSRRLSRPLDALVSFTDRIAAGKLEPQPADGPVEIRVLGEAMNRMVGELADSRRHLADKERLEKELEIATRIQTSILPRQQPVVGLELAARMIPATEVGGDYYDVRGRADGAWIGIGDVAGHGLTAGLVMMMVQSSIASLVTERPDASPREILRVVNVVIYENVRRRLFQDEHVTLTLLRYYPDGRVVFAGAHEEIVVWRAATGQCERIATPGTWLGAVFDIERFTVDNELRLARGDLLVLYSDGLIQAMDATGEQFGIERLCEAILRLNARTAELILAGVLGEVQSFAKEQADDITLLIARYQG